MISSFDESHKLLLAGHVVALPTETVYGLAAIATDKNAVNEIYRLKGRPANNPLIVHVYDQQQAESVASLNDWAKLLIPHFWPGPLSFVLPKLPILPDEITCGGDTVALRAPSHPVFRKMLKTIGLPLAAPSANPSNRTSPTEAKHVIDLFGKDSPPILDGGACTHGIESTVLDLSTELPRILRYGPISPSKIEEILNHTVLPPPSPIHSESNFKSPGTQRLHYAPVTPLNVFNSMEDVLKLQLSEKDDLLILPEKNDFPKAKLSPSFPCIFLSNDGSPKSIARNLYRCFLLADKKGAKRLIALQPKLNDEISLAIHDRMKRASLNNF